MNYLGLTKKESEKRLKKYGFNEIKEKNLASPLKILYRQIKGDLIIYLLFTAMIISFFVHEAITGYTISVVILIVISVGFIQEYRAEKAVQALKNMLTPISIVIRDGKEKEIPSNEIVPGDIIVLRSGEKVPADCIILDEKDLLINESILTGESKEIKKLNAKSENDYNENNMLFMGSFLFNGKCTVKVISTGMNTKFGKISEMISEAEKELPLKTKMNKITRYTTYVALLFSIATGILILVSEPFSSSLLIKALILMIALAVSAFPEGMPVVLITALASGSYKMAKKNAIVNRMSIIETLGETTVICSDKTGTITKGEMTVKKIIENNNIIEITGTGYEEVGKFLEKNKEIDPKRNIVLDLILKASVLCNDAKIEKFGENNKFHIIGSPTESALLVMASKAGLFKEDIKSNRLEEILFNSERKIMTILTKYEKQNYVFSKGAPEFLLNKCKYYQKDNKILKLTEIEKNKILEKNKFLTKDCLRTLSIAYKKDSSIKKEDLEKDLIFLGLVAMEDPPRDEVKESIRLCIIAGIKVKMVTGDNKDTAIAIAREIGLKGDILEGNEIDSMSPEDLSKIINKITIFARVRPEHKIKIVKALKINGEIVTMTGDGVNDAPALKEAHIGVAMGKNGTDVSRSVADLTLKDDNFATIVEAIKEGRTIFNNIRKFLTYQLSCTAAELGILFFGVLLAPYLGWEIPILLALQILFMNLVTDDIPSITLALNPVSKDVMQRNPRKTKDLLNNSLNILILISATFMVLITLGVFYLTHNIIGQNFQTARTTALVCLVFLEIASAFNFVSFRKKVNLERIITNKYLLLASSISIIATILIIHTKLNIIFETVPISLLNWTLAILASLLIVLVFNIIKIIDEKKNFLDLENL